MALFGSQVSGGVDEKSDKDLLIVCPLNEKKRYIKEYKNHGYSISVYTPEQLKYMKEKGSLFIQHLKNESRILFDKNNQLHNFLQTSTLVLPSNSELQRSVNSLNAAASAPKCSYLYGWLADHVFVLSRDYLVKYFAQKNKLVFNVNNLRKCIEDEFQLNSTESNVLLKLREAKYAYRKGSINLIMQHFAVEEWFNILQKIDVLKQTKETHTHTNASYLNIHIIYEFNSQYELLRYIESLRLLFPDTKCDDNKETLINRLIKRPNEYSSTSKKSQYFLQSYLHEFRNKANKALKSDPKSYAPFVALRYNATKAT